MFRKKPFSASKHAKDMLAYRKGTTYYLMQQTTAIHEHGSKSCSMEILHEITFFFLNILYIFTKILLLVEPYLLFLPFLSFD